MPNQSDPVRAAADAGRTREDLLEELQQLRRQLARSESDIAAGTPSPCAESRAEGDTPLKRIMDATPVFAFAVDANGIITFGSGED